MTTHPNRRAVMAGAAALMIPAVARAQSMRMRVSFDDQEAVYQLFDNATTRDLISMLPTELEIKDFSTNEKIVHLPRRLDEGGFEAFSDETPGDLCYFLGWGNLALFHDDYTFRDDLIRLGHIEGGVAPLLHKGTYPVRIEMI
ncbi:cyclophilin-like fold protein [Phaeobacter sp. 22II1-1F12B]|uniref:cyclophilin-like fold protein n=1 Tax=Phaeobacter sp. 22II1-1F12B TaxID=1317111 RepID=UPI000B51FE4B|nr:cyclophilin-like fold protein [Phaeobacter sp. 22II1-1F12B]OWU68320.1 MFS transporter [Phaeobacter sp. 22II1-1F12B]